MFTKILIANRGEIACRVAATAKRMGVRTVAVYSDADRHAKHVSVCDEAVYLGGSAPKDSYLKGDLLIQIAKETGAEAIHPGYGFLSENASFAKACEDAGIAFIGPSASAITAMGLKSESKQLMETAGVPLIPGYHGDNQDPEFLHKEADRIGYPLLIKASSGGGGKGMRLVERSEDFISLLDSCRREAITSFGNDAVLLEKYALNPRHIEIQVFGDSHGNYVHLFERDCSVQRRHQKVLEEAPAPGVDEAMRQAMGTAAINAARAVDYVGAGTVEFIVEQRPSADGKVEMGFYFMEMNTRLQVEHPVTEAITGMDLVEWQLIVAAGGEIPVKQQELAINGHAIEARICAENPDNDFLPATGTLLTYRKPEHSTFSVGSVRVDDGVEEGDVISPFYDSMIAKLIVHAPTREQALAKLDQALALTRIVGLPNNVAFLRHILATESFSQAKLDTALIEREKQALFNQQPLSLEMLVTTAVVNKLTQEQDALMTNGHHSNSAQQNDPFASLGGWRGYSDYQRQFSLVLESKNKETEKQYVAVISDVTANNKRLETANSSSFDLTIRELEADDDVLTPQPLDANDSEINAGAVYSGRVEYKATDSNSYVLWLDGQRLTAQSWVEGDDVHVFTHTGSGVITLIDAMAHVEGDTQAAGSLKSPMPGQVVAFRVAEGDSVKQGQPLAVIEAMKIEHTINAPADGVVAELLFAPGDLVADGDELLRLDTE
ncbi:acetyl/propionyl/methylcrotonyl-CoA carboxylase subunit alpha [Psychrobacter sp. FDAARGOS_221]|uniref:acetyl-CoA carboxylase biotin carboxylase subunit n=1 Tax=Psychrobacter sp. FDAARGOS_221 TaxID=1975705 RepID=UPI000BB575B1|nr:acetyl/propionyl/methylcrotonyl-CoA carboxylase subunit alpha [Psychrobacter sp. FDAARGOS_221]PNK61095.1 acetyl/propionyl/methylcrotonyl-CoA carboxylase subunit alpha [Psychrobacter sp. FDAARGOS_221]